MELPEVGASQQPTQLTEHEQNFLMYKKQLDRLLEDYPRGDQRNKEVVKEIQRLRDKIKKVTKKIKNVDLLDIKQAAKSDKERKQEQRRKQTDDDKMRERERDAERKRRLRGKEKKARSRGSQQVVEDFTAHEMDTTHVKVQVPGEVEPDQDGGLKMKRFEVLVSTMISNCCAGVTLRLQAAHHQ